MRQIISQLSKLAIILGVVIPAVAWGQASPQAEALFRDGKQLMKDGKLDEACSAFEGSEHAEHNVATLLSLADCREKNHQYAAAWALVPPGRQPDALRSVEGRRSTRRPRPARAALESRLSYLTINVPDESRIPELVVLRDGHAGRSGRVEPLDPGRRRPSRDRRQGAGPRVVVDHGDARPENDKQAVEVPRFKALPEIVNKPAHDAAGQPLMLPAQPPEPSPFTRRRKIGIGVAAGGVVVAAVAIGIGASASSLRNDAVATCPPAACTPAAARDAQNKNDRARSRAMIANVGFGVAGAAVVAGAVLWFTGKPESPSTIAIAPQVGSTTGLAVVGRF